MEFRVDHGDIPEPSDDLELLVLVEVPLDGFGEEPVVPHLVFVLLGDPDQDFRRLVVEVKGLPDGMADRVALLLAEGAVDARALHHQRRGGELLQLVVQLQHASSISGM